MEVFLSMFSTFSNLTIKINWQFRKEEKSPIELDLVKRDSIVLLISKKKMNNIKYYLLLNNFYCENTNM